MVFVFHLLVGLCFAVTLELMQFPLGPGVRKAGDFTRTKRLCYRIPLTSLLTCWKKYGNQQIAVSLSNSKLGISRAAVER
jgi:hypothetical protein